jgi:hypothetical protein
LQQLLEVIRIKPEHRSDEEPSTSLTREEGATYSYFSQMATWHKVSKIAPNMIEFLTPEMQDQGTITKSPIITRFTDAHYNTIRIAHRIAHDIWFHAESTSSELEKVVVEKTKIQQWYTTLYRRRV